MTAVTDIVGLVVGTVALCGLFGLALALCRAAATPAPLPPMHSAYDEADTLPAIPLMRSEPAPLWRPQTWRERAESEAWR